MPIVVFNADDFGLSKGVNYGILDSHLYGVVASTTMLVNMPATEHAVALAKQHPSLQVGIHLALTIGAPVSSEVPSLVDHSGQFRKLQAQRNEAIINPDDVLREWSLQIETFLRYGLKPSHLDSHHHIHRWAHLRTVIEELSKTYQLPWRHSFEQMPEGAAFYTESFDDRFYKNGVSNQGIDQILADHTDVHSLEIMCHPAYGDEPLQQTSSYVEDRVKETEILIHYSLPSGWTLPAQKKDTPSTS
ncbi:chitin disaccharide deacetylase [Alkalihalobacillus sp. LMS6]|uniref:chitin disaccharide deacetylase n=1 Tax=Alkalihalobacillus sp. LMS6 TaxID=2924034 RepID=UPI0020D1848A|nr:chitin disaccharide deacetylase [Alkalihalobacillus sp. LMS6]UTR06963.1 chitin disaccharide deacetylase [Alkalihalobacillus sp. LMS6]